MAKVLNFGSLNLDIVYSLDHIVREGETISSSHVEQYCGGKGLNQSVALKKAGADLYHAGAVGKEDGMILKNTLRELGADTRFIKEYNQKSGHAVIQVSKQGENCIILYPGTNHSIQRKDMDETLSYFEAGDFLVRQNEINDMQYLMEQAYQKGLRMVLNPSPMDEKIPTYPLDYVEFFILNEIEARDILKKESQLSEGLIARFPDSKIVLTLGKKGVAYRDKNCSYSNCAYPVEAVDTTAAGDTFTGYFIASIAAGKAVPSALNLASVAASITVSRKGAASSIPSLQEVLSSPYLKGERSRDEYL